MFLAASPNWFRALTSHPPLHCRHFLFQVLDLAPTPTLLLQVLEKFEASDVILGNHFYLCNQETMADIARVIAPVRQTRGGW